MGSLSNKDGSRYVAHETADGTIICFDPKQDSDSDGLSDFDELSMALILKKLIQMETVSLMATR